ncbi:premnaspirodiene oxygenase-like [Salvia miltiorrhiza]|uniref:premnaspirodiene oxygenase-like n=1 Tax=Salvia miltiorrhiza TaxID=226208 RepID=UPI0025ABDE69|nr:premnaspirodiene oxygenase-like [Salvia miltiorrhiza]
MKLEYLVYLSLFILLLLKLRKSSKQNKNILFPLPPGPWKLPLIGDMHLLFGSLPHIALRDLSTKYGPLMYLRLGQVPTIIVSSSDAAKQVMKTHDLTFASRPQLLALKIMSYDCTDVAFAPYGNYWRQLRKICTLELLSAKRVQSFQSLRQEEILILTRSIASRAGSPVNLTAETYASAYGFTSRAAFGMKNTKGQEAFVSLVQQGIEMASGFDLADVYPTVRLLQAMSPTRWRLTKLHRHVDKILENIINQHKLDKTAETVNSSTRQDDLVDVLLRFQESGHELPLTTDNIKAVILDVFSAGSETSAATVAWAMTEMMRHTRVLKRVQGEVRRVFKDKGCVDEARFDQLKYLKCVIKETLRLHPPLPLLLPRECSQVCSINGYQIPLKARIMVNAWAIGRDPKQWDDAESFVPERFLDALIDFKGNNFEFIPFGAGRRICPGITFGLANVELQLATFLYHFDWSLPDGIEPHQLAMTETFGATVRRKDDLLAVPTIKIPLPFL